MTILPHPQRRQNTCTGTDTTYMEQDPTVGEWLRSLIPTLPGILRYLSQVFLYVRWLPSYCGRWLLGDIIAGITVGFVVILQVMVYTLLAKLTPEYSLYTSFVGAVLYWIFSTSKDIIISTTAVGSLLVRSVVTSVQEQVPEGTYTNDQIAKTVSAISGLILLGLGLVRLDWIIKFIPYIPISAFVTAAAITIMATQFPTLMGITGVDTRQAPYLVIINSLKALPNTQIDAAIGLTSLVLLFAIRYFCDWMGSRYTKQKKAWAIISSLRLTFTILLYTFISWLVNRNLTGKSPFHIVGHIKQGFQRAGPPSFDQDLAVLVLPKIPAMIIILIIEHVAIAKSFGRQYGYTVVPSQEMLAQGASNFFGTFVGGYACTGSFGASAVLSKAGVRTPLAGLYSAAILVLALYALTAVFYYIPMAALAGLIIHAVLNLPTPPKTILKYWRLGPVEFIIWWAGVLIAIFESLEVSIYVTICLSLAVLLVRVAHTNGLFLGQIPVYHSDNSNPSLSISAPYPGVFIYRFPTIFCYANQAQHVQRLTQYLKANTQQPPAPKNPADRLWCEASNSPAGGRTKKDKDNSSEKTHHHDHDEEDHLPPLRAVILDCSAIDTMDITAIQGLVDARKTLDRHASCEGDGSGGCVQWHFAGVWNPWTRKALVVAGFGILPGGKCGKKDKKANGDVEAVSGNYHGDQEMKKNATTSTQSEGEGESEDSEGQGNNPVVNRAVRYSNKRYENLPDKTVCEDMCERAAVLGADGEEKMVPVRGTDRPFFHLGLGDAVDAAVAFTRCMDARGRRREGDVKLEEVKQSKVEERGGEEDRYRDTQDMHN